MFPEPCPRIRYGFQGSRLLITVAIAMGILSPSFLTSSSGSLSFLRGLKDLNLFLFFSLPKDMLILLVFSKTQLFALFLSLFFFSNLQSFLLVWIRFVLFLVSS